jgi:hypothetical protein
MTHAAAAIRTLQLPAVGHQGRRRGSAPAHCRRARPSIAYGGDANLSKDPS